MNVLTSIGLKKHKGSWFNLSHSNKLSMRFSRLYPINLDECLPGDHFKENFNCFSLMAPTIAPILQDVKMKIYNFFVPNRLLWSDWQNFINDAKEDQLPETPKAYIAELMRLWLGSPKLRKNQDGGSIEDSSSFIKYLEQPIPTFNSDIFFISDSKSNFILVYDYKNCPNWLKFRDEDSGNKGNYWIVLLAYQVYNFYKSFGVGSLLDYFGCSLDLSSIMETFGVKFPITFVGANPEDGKVVIHNFDELMSSVGACFDLAKRFYEENGVSGFNAWEYGHDQWGLNQFSDIRNYIKLHLGSGYDEMFHWFLRDRTTPNSKSLNVPVVNPLAIMYNIATFVEPANKYLSVDGSFSLLPFAAYQFIVDEYFVDENLDHVHDWRAVVDDANKVLGRLPILGIKSVLDVLSLFCFRNKCWAHDYFTSSLPDPQYGKPVNLPIAPTSGIVTDSKGDTGAAVKSIGTIEDLRVANKLQQFREILARTGHRYKESIYGLFGVRVPDYRLDRPEFLSAGNIPLNVGVINQTSASTKDSPLGDYAGYGEIRGGAGSFKYRVDEYGFIISMVCIIPQASYGQGQRRLFSRTDRFDFAFPQFATLGEQSTHSGELFYTGMSSMDDKVFGYMPRYSEYKVRVNEFHGDFRSSLSYWHMGRIFANIPAFNAEFQHVDENSCNRVFNTSGLPDDKFYCQFGIKEHVYRKLPKIVIPRLG